MSEPANWIVVFPFEWYESTQADPRDAAREAFKWFPHELSMGAEAYVIDRSSALRYTLDLNEHEGVSS